jgi:hypothetical protein
VRTDVQILRAAIGDASLDLPERLEDKESGRFRFYCVQLPLPRYRGLPPVWHFAVASSLDRPLNPREAETLLDEARHLIRKNVHAATGNSATKPLVLVCDDPGVRLNDKLRFDDKNVFFIDEPMLPSSKNYPRHPRTAPFISAVLNKLDARDLGTLLFEPYQPEKPAQGWRFFGRRRELESVSKSRARQFTHPTYSS